MVDEQILKIDENARKCRCCLTQSITVHPARVPHIPEYLFTFGPDQLIFLSSVVGCPPSLSAWHVVSCSWSQSIDQLPVRPFGAGASFEPRKVLGPWRLKSAALALGVCGVCRFVSKRSMRSRAKMNSCRRGSRTPLGSLRIDGCHFVDENNRLLLPRGFQSSNFSGWRNTSGRPAIL